QGGDFTEGDLTGTNNASVASQGLSAKGYFTWDNSNLYFASICTDNTIKQVDGINKYYLATDNRLFVKNASGVKEIRFINTINGAISIHNPGSGFALADGVTTSIKVQGNQYSFEATIPWSILGITSPKSGNQLLINFAQTSSKSVTDLNSVIYAPYNWFGATDVYFEKVELSGTPSVSKPSNDIKNPVKATDSQMKIDGVREGSYSPIFDFNTSNAGLVFGQGGDFPEGDLTMLNNAKVNAQGLSAKGYFTWDESYLYFISECMDNSILKVDGLNQFYLATDNRLFIKGQNAIKEIRLINTADGAIAIHNPGEGFVAANEVKASIKTYGNNGYSIEARIPWSFIGIDSPAAGKKILINFVQTSSKSLSSVNSVIYSKYNWFGSADTYFEAVELVGTPMNPATSDSVQFILFCLLLISSVGIIMFVLKENKIKNTDLV
ncbi:MAG: hypothetical protein EHM73_15380, partial [Chroococcales cyanobacterium metabat2.561]